jgi:DNA-directed RNA polymerase subunit RPC12/RpoP
MALGVCGTCGRAFVFENGTQPGTDRCPECGTALRVTTLAEYRRGLLPARVPPVRPRVGVRA